MQRSDGKLLQLDSLPLDWAGKRVEGEIRQAAAPQSNWRGRVMNRRRIRHWQRNINRYDSKSRTSVEWRDEFNRIYVAIDLVNQLTCNFIIVERNATRDSGAKAQSRSMLNGRGELMKLKPQLINASW